MKHIIANPEHAGEQKQRVSEAAKGPDICTHCLRWVFADNCPWCGRVPITMPPLDASQPASATPQPPQQITAAPETLRTSEPQREERGDTWGSVVPQLCPSCGEQIGWKPKA